ncbi:GspS/AspS pilotin family protein [Vibrio ziniensis]|uniref:Type II secretion system pilot lipoprotein GspS-beta n=1 Tax=Vibrio ziniensis TaxID=2711221 RepID=A0A6G7CHJ5_9VIBR|nr:GspS/AspS pilotin family protein [Vibrio ziniensis]QIH41506.1 type II secretion system pilot lipoprotein GspS-beta [Vibrio ziniensis]
MKKYIASFITFSLILLSGCSSNAENQRNLELLAENRASLLSAELPLEYGPLNILRANAQGTTIEMMMVYNADGKNAKPVAEVLKNSIKSFCSDKNIKANLEVGISYRIKMRNTRGQLMVDELITQQTCTSL